MELTRQISLKESFYRHLFGCKEEITDLFLRKFSCHVELRGPKLSGDQAASAKPDLVYERRILGGPVVSVWKDDLTRQNADVVVNAANERLDHIGGLAKALLDAGGAVIEKDSKEHIQRYGELKTGEYVVTRPGNLPCKCLLHTVGPVWFQDIADKCDFELTESIRNVMKYVNKHNDIKSVAIPAVSSGIFGFPLQQCADIIVKTIQSSYHASHLKEIRLVNNNDPAVQAMKSACETILGPSDDRNGAASASGNQTRPMTRSMTSRPQPSSTAPGNRAANMQPSGASSEMYKSANAQPSGPSSEMYKSANAQPSGPSSEMSPSITINGLTLHLIRGLIEEQKTQIIVNSVTSNLELDSGLISKAIFSKAGYKLQEEIRSKRSHLHNKNPAANITMIPTWGYNLPCEYVYHVIFSSTSYYFALQRLAHVTLECLNNAHTYKGRSMSFPALGTGGVGLSKQDVAKVMTANVINFARAHQCQLDVYFVIHPEDRDTYQAFRDQMNLHRLFTNTDATAKHRDPTPDIREKSSEFQDSEIPHLVINASSNEDIEEAEAWLANVLLSQSVTIQNNLILLFGIEEHYVLSSPDFPDVSIEEIVLSGTSGVKIDGPLQDKVKAVIQMDRLLLDVQEKHAVTLEEELLEAAVIWFYKDDFGAWRYPAKANRELEEAFVRQHDITLTSEPNHKIFMKNLKAEGKNGKFHLQRRTIRESSKDVQKKRRPEDWKPQVVLVDPKSQEFQDCSNKFKKDKLTLVKMEKIQNRYLSEILQYKKEAKPSNQKTSQLYHLVPRQFTKLVCKVGFQRIFSSPKDTKNGQGIYFTDSPRRAVDFFHTPKDGFLYIFQAEVLTNNMIDIKDSKYILPKKPIHKAEADDILDLCDSLVNSTIGPSIYVIPDSFQANPVSVFTCKPCNGNSSRR